MIAEALKMLTDLARTSASAQKIESGNPRTIKYVVNGEVNETESAPPPRQHEPASLEAVVSLANRFAAEKNADSGFVSPVVWYDETGVVLVIDDGGHRIETATLELEYSDVFRKLLELATSKPKFDQKQFVRLLRIDLAGALDPVVLLNSVRAVRWSSQTDVNVGKQRESLGRDIEARSADGKDLPEEVTLAVPVYKTLGERSPVSVKCSVEVDPAGGTFQLLPLPDELDRVRQVAVTRIAAALSDRLDTSVPAYYGQP